MRANQETLVAVARQHGKATASSWQAWANPDDTADGVYVFHYNTLMFIVRADNTVEPVSRGWGSMTDKTGTRKILRNVNGQGYAEVYASI